MTRNYMMIKEWLLDKNQREARRYNLYIDTLERTDDEFRKAVVHEDGFVKVIVEVLGETEKALKVRFQTGDVGSADGWTAWLPKSQVKVVA